ncbi:MAG: glycosyltransferase family 4 protein [Planctomycetes bacterium]|nr:glycosyltransferase family 4 protein [Planctomycetota bacterium]
MSTLRIGIDYRPALFSRSGIARSVRELARAIVAHTDVRLELFAHGMKRPLREELTTAIGRHGDSLHRSRLPGRSLQALAKFGIDASRLVRSHHRECIDAFHWMDYVYPPVRSQLPVTMTVHDIAFAQDTSLHGSAASAMLEARFESALCRVQAIACPTQATARRLRARWPDAPRASVIPFGVDHVACEPDEQDRRRARGRALAHELSGSTEYALAIGTIEPRKNHATLLDALDLLALSGVVVPLIVVGARGWECDAVVRRLRSTHSFPCHWLPEATDRIALDLLSAASILVYPSNLEGFGFPPLEALECGVPAIVGSCASMQETCGDAAVHVDGTDADQLALAIRHLMSDRDLRRKCLEAWSERRSRFTWERCARDHAAFWKALR